MSAAGFWTGIALGLLWSVAMSVAAVLDTRGSFGAMSIRATQSTVLWILLSPFVGGSLGFLLGFVADLIKGVL